MTTRAFRVYFYFRLWKKGADPYVLMQEPSRIFGSRICEFNHCFLMSDARINSPLYLELGSLIFVLKKCVIWVEHKKNLTVKFNKPISTFEWRLGQQIRFNLRLDPRLTRVLPEVFYFILFLLLKR